MKLTLVRSVNGRMRYYTLELTPNLFGEWVLSRTYGAIRAIKPTGSLCELYKNIDEAHMSMEALIQAKRKKGYIQR